MPEVYRPKGLSSAVCYLDAKAAYRWLEQDVRTSPEVAAWVAAGHLLRLGPATMTNASTPVLKLKATAVETTASSASRDDTVGPPIRVRHLAEWPSST